MKQLLEAHSIEIQKQLAKYKSKNELADILHILRFKRELKTPKGVKRVLDWVAEMNGKCNSSNGIGAFYYSEQTIANEIGCSLSTVERAFRWLKKWGFMKILQAWNDFEGKYGSAYKVFADSKKISIIINAFVQNRKDLIKTTIENMDNEFDEIIRKMTGSKEETEVIEDKALEPVENNEINRKMTGSMTGSVTGNKRPLINNLDKKDLNNNNKSIIEFDLNFPIKIKRKIKLLFTERNLRSLDDEEKYELANRIQMCLSQWGFDILDNQQTMRDIQNTILDWLSSADSFNDKYGAFYRMIDNEIHIIEMNNDSAFNKWFLEQNIDESNYIFDIRNEDSELKHGKDGEYFIDNFKLKLYKEWIKGSYEVLNEMVQAMQEIGATKEVKKSLRPKKPTRTETLPSWFDKRDKAKQMIKEGYSLEEIIRVTGDYEQNIRRYANDYGIKYA